MVLIIDCFKLVKGAGKSVGIYNLAKNLVQSLVTEKKSNRLIVFGNSYNRQDFETEGVGFVEIEHDPLNKLRCIWWELFEASVLARKYKADIVLYPRGYASILHLTREAIIVHDMIPFYYHEHYKGYFNRLENFYIMKRLRASVRHADRVITISEASKRDILKYAGVKEDKITIIYNGYNRIEETHKETVKEDYIIAVTSALPHKNAEGIVRAYEQYYQKASQPLPLRIIGISDAAGYGISAEIQSQITCYRYIESDSEMHQMIAYARIFLFLSQIEGFGFPPIEAMQLGTPVICSDTSSLSEVVGSAALLTDPNDPAQTADELLRLQEDTVLQQRLIEDGYRNVDRFAWTQTAARYAEVLFQKCQ